MPHACTRILTCAGPGSGMSRSTSSKSAPGFGTCTACIVAIISLPLQRQSTTRHCQVSTSPRKCHTPSAIAAFPVLCDVSDERQQEPLQEWNNRNPMGGGALWWEGEGE